MKVLTTPSLLLLLLAILAAAVYLSLPVIKSTQLYKDYDNNKEITFVSERAKFSFKHPKWWPVSVIDFNRNGGKFYDYLIEDGVVEYVDFEEEFSNQAGGPSLGFIRVEKTNYKNLNEYVESINKEEVIELYVKGRNEKVVIPAPKIEYLKIGGEDAISVIVNDPLANSSFSNNLSEYRLIRGGFLYRFYTVDSSRFLEDKEKNSKTFQQIIDSVRFF